MLTASLICWSPDSLILVTSLQIPNRTGLALPAGPLTDTGRCDRRCWEIGVVREAAGSGPGCSRRRTTVNVVGMY